MVEANGADDRVAVRLSGEQREVFADVQPWYGGADRGELAADFRRLRRFRIERCLLYTSPSPRDS